MTDERTKMEIRCGVEQKQRWTDAAGGAGNLSQWSRDRLDEAAGLPDKDGIQVKVDGMRLHDGAVIRGEAGKTYRVVEITEGAKLSELLADDVPVSDAERFTAVGTAGQEYEFWQADPTGHNPDYVLTTDDEVPRPATEEERKILGLPDKLSDVIPVPEIEILKDGPDGRGEPEGDSPEGAQTSGPPLSEEKQETLVSLREQVAEIEYVDDTIPEPDDPDELPPPRMIEAEVPLAPPGHPDSFIPVNTLVETSSGALAEVPVPPVPPSPLSPTCVNAAMHWRLTSGEACRFCGGGIG